MAKIISEEKTTILEQPDRSARRFNLQLIHWVVLLLILALVGAGLSFALYNNSQKQLKAVQKQLADYKKDPNAAAKQETQDLIAKVGQLVVLPTDETPTVATVTDLSKLQDQPFFAGAQVGDKVLIYNNAKKAILYRPATHKIIEVAPINIGGSAGAGAQTQAAAAPPPADKSQIPIKVLNASRVSGLARKVADKFKAAGYTNVTVSDASSGTQTQTTVNYDSKYSADIADINKVINNQASPQEQVGIAVITIVLGSNFVIQ